MKKQKKAKPIIAWCAVDEDNEIIEWLAFCDREAAVSALHDYISNAHECRIAKVKITEI